MITNLTPHPIVLVHENGETVTFPPSGEVARCEEHSHPAGDLQGLPIIYRTYGKPWLYGADGSERELPGPEENTLYLVSAMVRAALPKRGDLLSPGDTIRDEGGRIVGCKNFVQN